MHLVLPVRRPVLNPLLCFFACIFGKVQTQGEGEYKYMSGSGKVVM